MYCKHCGSEIHDDCVVCVKCGKQVRSMNQASAQPQIVITNTNTNVAASGYPRKGINKWVSWILCLCLGFFGAHKFYEGRVGSGVLYLLTGGVFFIGWIIDCITILFKPNPYYV